MNLNSYPVPHPQVAARTVEAQAVIVLADSGEVNILNPVGTRIWDLIDGTHTIHQILEVIVAEYKVTPAQALQDVENFVQMLVEVNAVTLKDKPTTI